MISYNKPRRTTTKAATNDNSSHQQHPTTPPIATGSTTARTIHDSSPTNTTPTNTRYGYHMDQPHQHQQRQRYEQPYTQAALSTQRLLIAKLTKLKKTNASNRRCPALRQHAQPPQNTSNGWPLIRCRSAQGRISVPWSLSMTYFTVCKR